jgi:hypothetical protein
MASIITATTTSGLTQSADNSGVLQLASGTGNLVTVPSVTGTAMVSGNMPAFSAIPSGTQSITVGVLTKVLFQTETFDTNNNFASSTFTPTVAGYYQINTVVYCAGVNTTYARAYIYKNGVQYKAAASGASSASFSMAIGDVIYFNGSTDNVEVYTFQGANETLNSPSLSSFSGVLVRAA